MVWVRHRRGRFSRLENNAEPLTSRESGVTIGLLSGKEQAHLTGTHPAAEGLRAGSYQG